MLLNKSVVSTLLGVFIRLWNHIGFFLQTKLAECLQSEFVVKIWGCINQKVQKWSIHWSSKVVTFYACLYKSDISRANCEDYFWSQRVKWSVICKSLKSFNTWKKKLTLLLKIYDFREKKNWRLRKEQNTFFFRVKFLYLLTLHANYTCSYIF